MVLTVEGLATTRPAPLRLSTLDVAWTRLDDQRPEDWSWRPFPLQRNRFDVPAARVRYAARTERGAFRERYADRKRIVRAEDADVAVVELRGRLRVVDLRNERTLDLLGADAEVSTGRSPRAFAACSALVARLLEWYGKDLHGVVYTSRTTPQTSANLAFFEHAPLRAREVGRLRERDALLAHLVVDDGFRLRLPGWS